MKTTSKKLNGNKKINMFLLLFMLVSVSAWAANINFSGVWALNKEKSELGERNWADIKKVIDQTSSELKMTRTFTNRNGEEIIREETYKLDGSGSVNEGFRDSQKKSTVKWSGDKKALIIESTMEFERDGEKTTLKFTEKYTLSEDGNTLTIVSTSDRGTVTMVYDKSPIANL